MLLKKWRRRDFTSRNLFPKTEISKLVLKSLMASSYLKSEDKIFFAGAFFRFSKFYSISFYRRNCVYSGYSRSVFQLFKMSRHQVKRNFALGNLTGVRKSSF